jgi:hypothetical protein
VKDKVWQGVDAVGLIEYKGEVRVVKQNGQLESLKKGEKLLIVADSIRYVASYENKLICSDNDGQLTIVYNDKSFETQLTIKGIRCLKIIDKWLLVETE